MANIPSPPHRDAAETTADVPLSAPRQALIFFGFLVWTALVMTAFLLNSGSHLVNKLEEFGVL